ncbi:hypothetical protein A2U01_0108047, partial [Trifolium medium]|nr:hypothetical protein [Trifolium medium]
GGSSAVKFRLGKIDGIVVLEPNVDDPPAAPS